MNRLGLLLVKSLRLLPGAWLSMPAWLRSLAPVAVMVTLWFTSSITPEPRPPSTVLDYLHNGAHIVAYATLAGAFLLMRNRAALVGSGAVRSWPAMSVVLSTLHGAFDEWHQSHVPGRVCSYGDLLADASGSVLGVVALLALLRTDWQLARWLPVCLAVCVGCVSIATWVSW